MFELTDYVNYLRQELGHKCVNLTGVCVLIINNSNEILLQKRGTFPYKWGLVGGITELGESLEETAYRETLEETGLTISDLELFDTVSGSHCLVIYPNGDQVFYITVAYVCKSYTGDIECDGVESQELKFFSSSNLPESIPKTHLHLIRKYYAL